MERPVRIDPAVYLCWALAILILPVQWIFAMVIAAAVHEWFHMIATWLTGGRIKSIRIGAGGAVIETGPMSRGRGLLCTAAGPLGSLLLFACYSRIPRIALCAGIQGIYNLLPLFPLDGGRFLRLLGGRKISRIAEYAVIAALIGGSIYISVKFLLGIAPVLLALGIGILRLGRKIPCKQDRFRVQ